MARLVVFSRTTLVLLFTALVAGACAVARPPATSGAPDKGCAVLPAPAAPVESASVVVTSPVDLSNAPRATTWGERFVFDLAYETFLRVDCRGRPLGEIPYRIRDLGLSRFLLEPVGGATGPRLSIRSATEADARDLIDAGVDLLLTDSPALATYAATRADVVSLPLAWDRTWVLVTPRQASIGQDSSATFRAGLARDVVRADARATEGPYWWRDLGGCNTPPETGTPPSRGSSRVVYSRDEPVARALAERLVALAGGATTAVGLMPNAFASALKARTELAYIMPLPRRSLDHCRAVDGLLSTAPWLARASSTHGVITPLIDTRLHAVGRRDRLNLAFTWDSTVTVLPTRP